MTEENCPNCGNEDCPEPSYDWISRAACERRAKEAALRELARFTASFAEIAESRKLATERAKADKWHAIAVTAQDDAEAMRPIVEAARQWAAAIARKSAAKSDPGPAYQIAWLESDTALAALLRACEDNP